MYYEMDLIMIGAQRIEIWTNDRMGLTLLLFCMVQQRLPPRSGCFVRCGILELRLPHRTMLQTLVGYSIQYKTGTYPGVEHGVELWCQCWQQGPTVASLLF